jgi:hypothetical protein
MVTVSEVRVYPVKSAAGLSVPRARVGDRGFEHDRRFMVVDAAGQVLTQRALPRMALLRVSLDGARLHIEAPGARRLALPLRPEAGARRRVEVWGDRCEALALGEDAARWLSDFLGLPCELVHMPDASVRPTDPAFGPGRVGFADGFPFLLASGSSLAELARRGADVPMARFRPNLVVDGAPPFAEDGWSRLRVGAIPLRVAKPCGRCLVTTVDPATGAFAGPEPLAALATFRRAGGEVLFGVNLVHEATGTIAVGDEVVVEA